MQLPTHTLRKIAALIFPFLTTGGLFLFSLMTQRPGKDDSLAGVVFFTISIVGSSLLLERKRSDRFWKVFLFSCFAGFLPIYLVGTVASIRFGFGGYFWLGFIVTNFLLVLSALCSLPFVGLFYWARGRLLDEELP